MLYSQLMRGAGFEPPKASKLIYCDYQSPYMFEYVDISDPANMVQMTFSGTTPIPQGASAKQKAYDSITGTYFVGAAQNGSDALYAVDVSDFNSPTSISSLSGSIYEPWLNTGFDRANNRVWFCGWDDSLGAIDVTDVSNISAVGTPLANFAPQQPDCLLVDLVNNVAYTIDQTTLKSADISTTSPTLLDTYSFPFNTLAQNNSFACNPARQELYIGAPRDGRFLIMDVSDPSNISSLAILVDIDYLVGNSICLDENNPDYVYVASQHYVSTVDVSVPTAPVIVDTLAVSDTAVDLEYILYDPTRNLLFTTGDNYLFSIDANDPLNLTEIGFIATPGLFHDFNLDVPGYSGTRVVGG